MFNYYCQCNYCQWYSESDVEHHDICHADFQQSVLGLIKTLVTVMTTYIHIYDPPPLVRLAISGPGPITDPSVGINEQ